VIFALVGMIIITGIAVGVTMLSSDKPNKITGIETVSEPLNQTPTITEISVTEILDSDVTAIEVGPTQVEQLENDIKELKQVAERIEVDIAKQEKLQAETSAKRIEEE